jgi:hypothetical protein
MVAEIDPFCNLKLSGPLQAMGAARSARAFPILSN